MTTLTRTDRDALAAFVTGDLPAVVRQFGQGRATRVAALTGGNRAAALHLVDVFDDLSAEPVLELPPLGVRPGRVIDPADPTHHAGATAPADNQMENATWQ
ncbi:hypothetical protein [Micromonospora globbae]|uniref:hypothetical protein n=1 Tax=Micromonospora globbae TaxID=1894969 RepID=UPI003427F22C